MTHDRKVREEMFPYVDILRAKAGGQAAGSVLMAIEFMKQQGEVAYEVGKRQAMSIASSATTVGIGWSAFFFGIAIDSWFTSGLGLVIVFGGTFFLGYLTPRILDKLRNSLIDSSMARLYEKWLADSSESQSPGKRQ